MDYHHGTVLYSLNASRPMYPASLSKLMTLYIIFERLATKQWTLDERLTVSERAWRHKG
ncbi:MAG: serine hydrolase, partial [Alphaproteobacteria bacterium GM7ARS4]|nr:serine hydrolase [Alphaproteobacteria bacterium GM7ARS4]